MTTILRTTNSMARGRKTFTCVLLLGLVLVTSSLAAPIPPIKRTIPPVGIKLPKEQVSALQARLKSLQTRFNGVAKTHGRDADIEVYLKAVRYALQHREFYRPRDVKLAERAMDEAQLRVTQLESGSTPWTSQSGLVVRGYYSNLDDSPQPYGLVVPEELPEAAKIPLYVWLHGRGDKVTDLHFIHRRSTSRGRIAPPGAIVLHPFGRHCVGFKHAGEIDVLNSIQDVIRQYPVDINRIVLMGFSMGGAGTWHVGAHYAPWFVAMSPGAGFAETAQYNRLKPKDYPASYEQTLWGLYDVPNYVRNLFNLPVVAYSGEKDKQIQAARVMERAFQDHGRRLPHVIGPEMGHNYDKKSLQSILSSMAQATQVSTANFLPPQKVSLQTRTLRYGAMHWVQLFQAVQTGN